MIEMKEWKNAFCEERRRAERVGASVRLVAERSEQHACAESHEVRIGELCPHGSNKNSYCKDCNGDIVVICQKKVIGILLDLSSSMRGRKIDSAKQAIENVLDKIPYDDIKVVFTIFSTELPENHLDIITYGSNFDSNIKKIAIEKLRKLQAGGGTPLYQAINNFIDDTWSMGALDKDKMFFPCTYLIVVSDGEDNQSINITYNGKKDKEGFFAKLFEYRNVGLITEVIPFAYGEIREIDIRLIQELKDISGKIFINEIDPTIITDKLINTIGYITNNITIENILGINITLDMPHEIAVKLIKIKKEEKYLLEHVDKLKDREFLKNLYNNIEDIIKVR